MDNNKINYTSKDDLNKRHEYLRNLINAPKTRKTLTERKHLLELEEKGLEYIKKTYKPNSAINSPEFTYNELSKKDLIEIGFALEKKDFLKESNANVLEKTNNQLELESVVQKAEKQLNLNQEDKLATPKPEPKPKIEEDTPEPERVKIDEKSLEQELIAKAQREGDTKEVILDKTVPTAAGQLASSLVVDIDDKKIDATIQQMDERLNPQKIEQPKIEEDALKEKNEDTKEQKNKNTNTNKLKPTPPKPGEKKDVKKPQNTEAFKPKPIVNFQQHLESLREKFKKNQEENPYEIEKQQFETVLKPQDKFNLNKKEQIVENIEAMTNRSRAGYAPAVVSTEDGPQEVRKKASLK